MLTPKSAAAERASDWKWRIALLALACGCLVLYLVGASGYDLLTDDEMRYAESGRRMVESGNWIIPEYNGYPRYQKPILFYWLQALAQAALGSSPWAARLPSAFAGVFLVLIMAQLGKALWGRRGGLLSGIALAVSVEIVLLARMVMTDIVLLLCIQSGLAAFYVGQLEAPPRRGRWYLLMHAALAFGFLTKGPIALVLPSAILLPWLAARGELLATLREARLGWGALLLVLIAGPWYFLADAFTRGEFTWHFFVTENLGRFTSNVNPHEAPPLLYFLILVPLTFPWAGVMPQALASALRTRWRGVPFREAVPWLLAWQIILVLLVFTLSRTRVWTYTLPILPPLALLVGRWLALQMEQPRQGWSPLRIPLYAFAVVSLGLFLAACALPLEALPLEARTEAIHSTIRLFTGMLFSLSLVLVFLDHCNRFALTLSGLVGGVACFYLAVALVAVPQVDAHLRAPVREAAVAIRANQADLVVTCMVHELGLNMHAQRRRVLHWRTHSPESLHLLLAGEQRVFLLIEPRKFGELADLPVHIWDAHPRFILAANFPPDPAYLASKRRANPPGSRLVLLREER